MRPIVSCLNLATSYKMNLFMWLDELGLTMTMPQRVQAWKDKSYQVLVNGKVLESETFKEWVSDESEVTVVIKKNMTPTQELEA